MDYQQLKKLTLKHINTAIDLIESTNETKPYTTGEPLSFRLDEQLFIALSFVGAYIERTDQNILGYQITQGLKYAWNYSKHGNRLFSYITVNTEPKFTFPLAFGDNHFTFGESYYAWSELPIDDDQNQGRKQFSAYNSTLKGKHMPNTFRDFMIIMDKYDEKNGPSES